MKKKMRNICALLFAFFSVSIMHTDIPLKADNEEICVDAAGNITTHCNEVITGEIEDEVKEVESGVEEQAADVYHEKRYEELWEQHETSHPISQAFRWVGWGIVQMLSTMLNGIESITSFAFEFMHEFFESEFVQDLSEKMNILAYAIISIQFVVLGMSFMIGKEKEVKKPIMNMMMVIGFIGAQTFIFDYGFQIVPLMQEYFKVSDEEMKIADNLLLNSITDIEYYKTQLEQGTQSDKKNNLTMKQLKYLDINKPANEKIFNRKITGYDEATGLVITTTYDSNGFFGFGSEYILLYQVDFFGITIQLFLLILLFIFLYRKEIMHILELGVVQIFYNFYAIFAIRDITKIKMLFMNIVKTFVSMIMLSFSIYYYVNFASFIATKNINIFVKLIFILANFSFAVGNSFVISTLFGVDNHLGGDFAKMYYKTRAVGRMARSVGRVATAPARAFNQYAAPSIMQGFGARQGEKIAQKRQSFFNDPQTQFSDYEGQKEQNYYAPDYQPGMHETDNKFMQTMRAKTGIDKHIKTFGEAKRKAYEQTFPTAVSSRAEVEKRHQADNVYYEHGAKYGEVGLKRQRALKAKEKERQTKFNNEHKYKRTENKSNFDDAKLSEASQREVEKLFDELEKEERERDN